MPTILLATGNIAKQAKLRWLIDGLGFEAVTPRDLGLSFDPPESGTTHQEIASSKALAWADADRLPRHRQRRRHRHPGARRELEQPLHRRATSDVPDDCARADHLVALMRGKIGAERDAFKREAVAVAQPGRLLGAWEAGGAIGRVVESSTRPTSKMDSGCPAVLWDPRFGKVVADLTPEEAEQTDNGWNALHEVVRPFLSGLLAPAR